MTGGYGFGRCHHFRLFWAVLTWMLGLLLVGVPALSGVGQGQAYQGATATPFFIFTPTAAGGSIADPTAVSTGHTLGPENAPVTLLLYGDFQCVLCARYARDLEELRARYPDSVRLIWRHLPDMRTHDKAALALQAAEAAAAQGQFWSMHDQLFTHLDQWQALSPADFRALLPGYAAIVGLDVGRFEAELDAGLYAPMVEVALRDAAEFEIMGAPILLLNGVPYSGRDDLFGLDEAVRLELLTLRHFAAAPPLTLEMGASYRATILTERGTIVIDLFSGAAPQAVNNFIFLAQNGWYDNTTFHYVIPGFIAQTGDPSGSGRGGPGYTIPDEHVNGLAFDQAGRVAMAHPAGEANSAGSQFFITMAPLAPASEWTGQYTIFGQVVAGMEIVEALTPRNANDPVNFPNPPPGDRVITIQIERF